VTASGDEPLSYQWRRDGLEVAGATEATLSLVEARLSDAGTYSVVVSNPAGSVTSDPAEVTVLVDLGRALVLSEVSGSLGQTVDVPVLLLAQGDENALGFSVEFDPAVLNFTEVVLGEGAAGAALNVNANQVGSGRLGLTLAFNAETRFAEGTQHVATVSFHIDNGVGSVITPLIFADTPVLREVSDVLAETLSTVYVNGRVEVQGGIEGDVAPLPTGNHLLTITDWVKVGRYASALDEFPSATQFQRADCAPRSSLGNGVMSVSDWVQAGRYVAGLDPVTTAGGPTGPLSPLSGPAGGGGGLAAASSPGAVRVVRVGGGSIGVGRTLSVPVFLAAEAGESALGFSLDFDAARFVLEGVSLGASAKGAVLHVNTNMQSAGRIGVALSLPIGASFGGGSQELITLTLAARPDASGIGSVTFADQPVMREVSDEFANVLEASYENGHLDVVPVLSIVRGEGNLELSWPSWAADYQLQSTTNLAVPAVWDPVDVTPEELEGEIRVVLPVSGAGAYYRLSR
jgi:hypothetical protein